MSTIWSGLGDFGSGAKYLKLAEGIRQIIANGTLEAHQKLPAVRELAYQINVTPGTVARAYRMLIEDGVLEAGVGRGTFVRDKKKQKPLLPPDIIRLNGPYLPDLGQGELIRDGFRDFAENGSDDGVMAYPHRTGSLHLRQVFCRFIGNTPIGAFDEEDVVITHGGQHAITACLQLLLGKTDRHVAVDAVSYPGFWEACEINRVMAVAVPWDEEGPRVDDFERIVVEMGVRIFLTSSEINNPTLRSTTRERRFALARVARKYNVNVIDDDCYRVAPAEAELYRALLPETGWYINSLSKNITPSLRIGCVVAPKRRAGEFSRVVLMGTFGVSAALKHVAQYVLNHPRIEAIMTATAEEVDRYIKCALNHLGAVSVRYRPGVPLIWIRLPAPWKPAEFARVAEKQGVLVEPATTFAAPYAAVPNGIRLSVNAAHGLEVFERSVEKIAYLMRNPTEKMTT